MNQSTLSSLALLATFATLCPLAAAQGSSQSSAGNQAGNYGGPLFERNPAKPLCMTPTNGGVGTYLTFSGDFSAYVGLYDPEDILMTSAAGEGVVGLGTALSATSVTARIDNMNPFAKPDAIALYFGQGAKVPVPQLAEVIYQDISVWSGPVPPQFTTTCLFNPDSSFVNHPATSQPVGPTLEPLPQSVPYDIQQPFRLEGGKLRVQLPGTTACQGDKLSIDLVFTTNTNTYLVQVPQTSPLFSPYNWIVGHTFLLLPLGIGLTGSNCVATYDSTTREIVICPNPGTTILSVKSPSAVMIELDPAEHTLFTAFTGDKDNYLNTTNSLDVPSPSPGFAAFKELKWPSNTYYPLRDYDQNGGCDAWLVETLDQNTSVSGTGNMGSAIFDGEIRSAVVELHLNGFNCQTYTDHIRLGWDGDGSATNKMEWAINMVDVPVSGGWKPGDDGTFCFDLSRLKRAGGIDSIIDTLAMRDALDVIVDDDTYVDYIEVRLLRCNP